MIKHYIKCYYNNNNNKNRNDITIQGMNEFNYIFNISLELDVMKTPNGWRIHGIHTPYLPIVYFRLNVNTFTVTNMLPIVVPGFSFFSVCVSAFVLCFLCACVHAFCCAKLFITTHRKKKSKQKYNTNKIHKHTLKKKIEKRKNHKNKRRTMLLDKFTLYSDCKRI